MPVQGLVCVADWPAVQLWEELKLPEGEFVLLVVALMDTVSVMLGDRVTDGIMLKLNVADPVPLKVEVTVREGVRLSVSELVQEIVTGLERDGV